MLKYGIFMMIKTWQQGNFLEKPVLVIFGFDFVGRINMDKNLTAFSLL